jgi:hypothetical protein
MIISGREIAVEYLLGGQTKEPMAEEYVSLKRLAEEIGMDRSHARRYVLKLGITPHNRRTPDSRGQLTLAVDQDEAELIRQKRREEGFIGDSKPVAKNVGEFYIIRLVPELDDRRVKMGFADDLSTRLSQHRTAAPTAQVLSSWPCRRSWESTVMDCLSAHNCRLILNEVFECDDVDGLVELANQLFRLLPDPTQKTPLAEFSPHNNVTQKSAE